MISSETEYRKAREELDHLTRWLAQVENKEGTERKGLTAASIRRMISRIEEEIAQYEAASASTPPASESAAAPDDAGADRRTEDRD